MKLKDRLPWEFMSGEHENSPAMKFAEIKVVGEYSEFQKRWIGKEKNVHVWFILENGYAVGFNENPQRGWSFPVKKIKT